MSTWGYGASMAIANAIQDVSQNGIINTAADNNAIGGASGYARQNNANMQNQYSNANSIIGNMNGVAGNLSGMSGTFMNNYNSTYMPAIGRASALANISEEEAAGKASVDSGIAYDKALGIQNRTMSRMGVNPNSGRFSGMLQDWGLARAAGEAAAKNKARKEARDASFSRNAAIAGLAGQAGNQAISSASAAGSLYGNSAGLSMGLGGIYGKEAAEAAKANQIGNGTGSSDSSGLWSGATSLNNMNKTTPYKSNWKDTIY